MNLKVLSALLLASSAAFCAGTGSVKKSAAKSVAKNEAKIVSKTGGQLAIGGSICNDYTFNKNVVFLNKNLPDEYGYLRNTLDLDGDYTWGKEEFGHDAVQVHAQARHRGYWGDADSSSKTASSGFKLADAADVGKHTHSIEKPMVWLRNAWMKVSVDAMTGLNNKGTHDLKVGYFPFSLGRGIALGEGYGTPKDFLGVYSRYNDYSAPGALFSGNIYDGKLGYDVYYAKFEDKSSSIRHTMSQTKAHRLDATTNESWNGVGNDDELYAVQINFAPSLGGELGTSSIKPYFMMNEARDRKIEMQSDASSTLMTMGCSFDYERSGFELGGEFGFNRGIEHVYEIDRMKVSIARNVNDDENPSLTFYSDKLVKGGVSGNTEYNETLKTALTGSSNRKRNENFSTTETNLDSVVVDYKDHSDSNATKTLLFSDEAAAKSYVDASDRIRPAYDNKYRGWMVLADMAYTLKNPNVKMAISGGWVSGDKNPNATEANKEYKGFVGLNEFYGGTRVKSAFILGARNVKRPLTYDDNTGSKFGSSDGTFTDLRFAGTSFTYKPKKFKNTSFMSNSMAFWKDHQSYKPVETNSVWAASATDKAARFLGVEYNLMITAELLENLTFSLIGAAFFPGQYYKDITGVPIASDYNKELNGSDTQDLDNVKYGMGHDRALYLRSGLEYRF
jgi:hypothetical protein